MEETTTQQRLPWGTITILALLAVLVGYVYYPTGAAAGWWTTALVFLTAAVTFFVGRGLLNGVWGFVMAVSLVLHPLYQHRVRADGQAVLTELLVLVVFGCLLLIWTQLFALRQRMLSLLGLGAVCICASAWVWLDSVHGGLTAILLAALGLLLGFVLALVQRRTSAARPALANVLWTALLVVLVPVGSVYLLTPLSKVRQSLAPSHAVEAAAEPSASATEDALAVFARSIQPQPRSDLFPGWSMAELRRWTWPHLWVVVVLMLLGLGRSLRRGWLRWCKQQPPLPWLLALLALAEIAAGSLNPESLRGGDFLPYALLSVLLGLFGLGDWIYSLGERMILAPPEDDTVTH